MDQRFAGKRRNICGVIEKDDYMQMLLLIVVAIMALLEGCVKDAVILVHPQTGKEQQCGPYYFTGMSSGILSEDAAQERERDCINDYEQQGYQRK